MGSSIEGASLAGTWISSSLAIIALIGIIGPFYALKTAYGKRTRVLNGVWDEYGTYLTKGWSIGNSPALFRRSRVPNLARNYQNNDYNVTSILPGEEDPARYQCLQNEVNFSSWNTGWGRLCALIQSHHTSLQHGNAGMCAGSTDGKLEIIDSFSALVVSRYWIFFLGLLGVYGQKEEGEHPQLALRPDTGADISDVMSNDSMFSNSHFYVDGEHSNDEDPTGHYRGFYSRHGVQIFSSSRAREIKGFTGSFKSLGRQKHSTGIRSLIAFQYATQPRAAPPVRRRGPFKRMPPTPSLQSRFWLAFGYVPGHKGEPISYLDPADPRLTASKAFSRGGEGLALHLSLRSSDDLPILLKYCSIALKTHSDASVLQWESSTESLQIAGEWQWHKVIQESQFPAIFLWRPDIVKALDAFLHIDCDDRGFLARKSPCTIWNQVMQLGPSMTDSFSFETVSEFLDGFLESRKHRNEQSASPEPKVEIQHKTVPAWDFENQQYFASKIRDLAQFENYLFELIKDCGVDVIHYPIAIAFILDEDFREDLRNTLIQDDEGSINHETPSHSNTESNHSTSRNESPLVSSKNTVSEDRNSGHDEPSSQPTQVLEQNVHNSPISEFSLNYHPAGSPNLPYEYGSNRSTVRLSWKRRGDEVQRSTEVPGYDCARLKSKGSPTGHVISMEGEDVNRIVLIAIWTVARCAIWRSSRDSWALIDFVNDLDRNIFVL